jgi:uncharacterized membrane protein YcaP (DUF421 family)
MFDWFAIDFQQFLGTVTSAIVVFFFMLLLIKISGLRSFAKMSSHDFGVTIAIGSILGATIINKEPSVLQGGLAIAALLGTQTLYSMWRRKRNKNYIENKPILIMKGRDILHDNLKSSQISVNDLYSKLREANVTNLDQVHAVVLEASGDISVLHSTQNYDESLLQGVREYEEEK